MSRKQDRRSAEEGPHIVLLWGSDREGSHNGRQSHASISGRIPINIDGAPALPRRPPHSMGMRPPAIAASCRHTGARNTGMDAEAAA